MFISPPNDLTAGVEREGWAVIVAASVLVPGVCSKLISSVSCPVIVKK